MNSTALKEVIAILRPERWPAVKSRLDRLPVAYSQCRVLGRRRHGSLRYLPRTGARPTVINHLPQRMICCEVEESLLDWVLQAFQADCTGRAGDGFVFVLPVEASYPLDAESFVTLGAPSPIPATGNIVHAAR